MEMCNFFEILSVYSIFPKRAVIRQALPLSPLNNGFTERFSKQIMLHLFPHYQCGRKRKILYAGYGQK